MFAFISDNWFPYLQKYFIIFIFYSENVKYKFKNIFTSSSCADHTYLFLHKYSLYALVLEEKSNLCVLLYPVMSKTLVGYLKGLKKNFFSYSVNVLSILCQNNVE